MKFVDTVKIAGTRKRAEDGALIVDANVARTGIQIYAGYEVGRPDLATVRVFRSADEVFSVDSLKSFAHRPITNDHPPVAVDSTNWKDFAVGQTADEVAAKDIYIRVPLMVSDQKAIDDIERGKRELSSGYACDLDWTPGINAKGEAFDAQQRMIRCNHIAIVDAGRAGSKVRIGDDAGKEWGVMPVIHDHKEPDIMTTKTMIVDGLPLLVTDQAEAMINKLVADKVKLIADHQTALAAATAANATIVAAKDTEIGTLTAKVKELTDTAITPDKMDQVVAARVALIADAKKIVPDVKTDGLTDAAIKKAVVEAKHGADFVKDKSEAFIDGVFAAMATMAKDAGQVGDVFRQHMQQTPPALDAKNDPNGQIGYEKRLTDAWRDKPVGNA